MQHVKVSKSHNRVRLCGPLSAAEVAHWAAQVTDTSGGCGTMYDVNITADAFRHA